MWHTEGMNNAGASSTCSKHRKYHPGAPFNFLPPFLFLSFQSNVHHKTCGKSSTICSLGSEGTGHPQNKVCSGGTGWHWELCSASPKRILAPKEEEKATWTRLNHTSVCSAVLTVLSYCTLCSLLHSTSFSPSEIAEIICLFLIFGLCPGCVDFATKSGPACAYIEYMRYLIPANIWYLLVSLNPPQSSILLLFPIDHCGHKMKLTKKIHRKRKAEQNKHKPDIFCSCAVDKCAPYSSLKGCCTYWCCWCHAIAKLKSFLPMSPYLICLDLSNVLILMEFCLTIQKLYQGALVYPRQCFSMHIIAVHCHMLL